MTLEKKNNFYRYTFHQYGYYYVFTKRSFFNIGYVILDEIYRELKLDLFWNSIASKLKITYNLEAIYRLLVFSRILYPASKKATYENRHVYFQKFDFHLSDLYRALDIFAKEEKNNSLLLYGIKELLSLYKMSLR